MAGRGETEQLVGALHRLLPPQPPLVQWLSARLGSGTRLLCSEGSRGARQLMGGTAVPAWVGGACWAPGQGWGSPSGSSHILHSSPRGSCFLWFYFPVSILER